MGGILQLPLDAASIPSKEINVYLREPDITTSNNIANAINTKFGGNIALAKDGAEVKVAVPADKQNNIVSFLSDLEALRFKRMRLQSCSGREDRNCCSRKQRKDLPHPLHTAT